jgi:glycyl-tRNA synthetase alpha chain
MSFVELVEKLSKFWSSKGVGLITPYDYPIGAATFHPENFFNSFKPCSFYFLQNCRRKGDARYGQSASRLSSFYQFQVFINPAPENIQDLYLDSLEYVGFNRNYAKFGDNNWNSASLGANGVGWQILYDFTEITQFTYFDKIGTIKLETTPVELAYGVERMLLMLNDVDTIFDVKFNETLSYRQLFLEKERQMSQFYLEINEPDKIEKDINLCQKLIDKKLYYPAYEILLRINDKYNELDALNLISEFDRNNYIKQMQNLSKSIATLYLESTKVLRFW